MVHAIIERKNAVDSLVILKTVLKYNRIQSNPKDWTLIHAYFANMGGVQMKLKYRGTDTVVSGSERPLVTTQIAGAIFFGLLTNLPSIQRKQIEFRSKSDLFAKGLALLQILWLVASLITRAVQKLAVSQLEIVTVAFAVCTIITYFFCMQKPQDVQIPVYLGELQFPSSLEAERLVSTQPTSLARYLLNPNSPPVGEWLERIPDDNFYPTMSTIQPVGPILCLATVSCRNPAWFI